MENLGGNWTGLQPGLQPGLSGFTPQVLLNADRSHDGANRLHLCASFGSVVRA